jgi:hypothetical protein
MNDNIQSTTPWNGFGGFRPLSPFLAESPFTDGRQQAAIDGASSLVVGAEPVESRQLLLQPGGSACR